MPGGDRTGPVGTGPMTGRRMGYCTGVSAPGYAGTGFGAGRGQRAMYIRGGTRCRYPYWNDAYYSPVPTEDRKTELQNQADFLERELKEVRERLSGLEKAD